MARDALLQTGGVFATAALTSGASPTAQVSPAISIEPFNNVGWNNNLYARLMMSQPTYAALPATASYFVFGVDVSQDGSVWTTVYQSPSDAQICQTHRVYEIRAASGGSAFYITKPSVSTATGATTSGSAVLTGLPLVSIGDAVYLTATAGGFTQAIPYYVVSTTPTVTSNVNTSTVQLALTPGGTPLVASATASSMTWTKYYPFPTQFAVGDLFLQTGTAITGTNVASAASDPTIATANVTKYYILSVSDAYNQVNITFAATPGGTATTTTAAIAAATTYAAVILPSQNAEIYFPLNSSTGFIDIYGNARDNYKYIRGSIKCVSSTGVNPTATFRVDVVPGRDGAYS